MGKTGKFSEHDRVNQKKFDQWARTFDKWNFVFRYLQKKVVQMIGPLADTNFLDLGCGTGWAVRYAAGLGRGKGNFVGIDISEKMIAKARANAAGQKNVSFHVASSEALPFGHRFFDNAICTFSFHHYSNPKHALAEVYRVLKQDARLYILDATPDDVFTKWVENKMHSLEKTHVKQYSTAEFRQMFSEAGLKYLGSESVLCYPIKVHIAEK